MLRRSPLKKVLNKQPSVRPKRPATAHKGSKPRSDSGKASSRSGRVLVGGHFAPEVQIALKIIAAEERITMQALLAEAINMAFAKRHKSKIATG